MPSDTADGECDLCGAVGAELYGEAHAYVHFPEDADREDAKVYLSTCVGCALGQQDNVDDVEDRFRPGDRKYLDTCDCCGAVGCGMSSVRAWAENKPEGAVNDRTYRIRTMYAYNVEIDGIGGPRTFCVDCLPFTPEDAIPDPDREYDEDAAELVQPPTDSESEAAGPTADRTQADISNWA